MYQLYLNKDKKLKRQHKAGKGPAICLIKQRRYISRENKTGMCTKHKPEIVAS